MAKKKIIDAPVNETPWIDWCKSHIGEHEISGKSANPFIVDLFKYTTFKSDSDETPWCAALVNAALQKLGFVGTESAAAKSFLSYGHSCALIFGCIVVVKRADGGHHVAFFVGFDENENMKLLGGNQRDSLSIASFKRESYVDSRWPQLVELEPSNASVLVDKPT
jgi:uncharacterized protein (TIGR02594 family)